MIRARAAAVKNTSIVTENWLNNTRFCEIQKRSLYFTMAALLRRLYSVWELSGV